MKWDKRLPPTPYPGCEALLWPAGEPAPRLREGMAGVSVRIMARDSDPIWMAKQRAVGIDGRPMWFGAGRAVMLVEPGEHLVEVQGDTGSETVRRVRAVAGEIAELEYWIPRAVFAVDGVLVPQPARARLGLGMWGAGAAFLVLFAAGWLGQSIDTGPRSLAIVAFTIGLFVAMPLTPYLLARGKGRLDRRYRARQSYEAAEADARSADIGAFLGDGAPPAGLADQTRGILVVTGVSRRRYLWNGAESLQRPFRDPNGWQPWPVLAIDGARRPFSWRTWCYRLPPGRHEVTVTLAPPGDGTAAGDGGPAIETSTSTATVEIVAGAVTNLELRVKSRIEVRTIERRRDSPTVVVGYRAEVKPKISAAR